MIPCSEPFYSRFDLQSNLLLVNELFASMEQADGKTLLCTITCLMLGGLMVIERSNKPSIEV